MWTRRAASARENRLPSQSNQIELRWIIPSARYVARRARASPRRRSSISSLVRAFSGVTVDFELVPSLPIDRIAPSPAL